MSSLKTMSKEWNLKIGRRRLPSIYEAPNSVACVQMSSCEMIAHSLHVATSVPSSTSACLFQHASVLVCLCCILTVQEKYLVSWTGYNHGPFGTQTPAGDFCIRCSFMMSLKIRSRQSWREDWCCIFKISKDLEYVDITLKALSFPVFESDSFLNSISQGIFFENRTELDEKSADLHTSSQVEPLCKCAPFAFPPPLFFIS